METTTPIRILRIIARMNVGGPAVQICNLMNRLDGRLFEQLLVTGYCGEDEKEHLDGEKVEFQVHRIRELGVSINFLRDFVAIFKIIKIIYIFKPDIIHTHTSKAGFMGRIAGIIYPRSIKLIHTFHGHLLYGYFSKWKTKLIISAEVILGYFTNYLIAVGETVKEELISVGVGNQHKFLVINPGIEETPKLEKNVWINKFNIPENKFIIAFVGRLTKIKRIDRLVEVIKLVKKELDGVHFIIAGGGIEEEYLKKQVEDFHLPVTYLGWIKSLNEITCLADAYILTSDNEGTPISLIQAMIAGIPIISTDVGSVSDVVENGVSGILTKANSEELFQAVKIISRNKEKYNLFSANSRQIGLSKFSLEKFIEKYTELYIEA
jgi:glycosyltransferase involved in cell wall biosynthesis